MKNMKAAVEIERERYERIGRLFCELWEMGAPWPVPRWKCNKHQVVGCIECRKPKR